MWQQPPEHCRGQAVFMPPLSPTLALKGGGRGDGMWTNGAKYSSYGDGYVSPSPPKPKTWNPQGAVAALLALPFGAFVIGLLASTFMALGDLGGRGPGVFAFAGLFGTAFTYPLMRYAVLCDRRSGLVGVLAGALLCGGLMYAVTGEGARTAWAAPAEGPDVSKAVGSWQSGDLVVRARPDAITAYRVSDGTVSWRWTPPGHDVVCAMSRATFSRTGLVGHALQGRACGRMTALNLETGTALWSEGIAPQAARSGPGHPDIMAVTDGVAVLPTKAGWRAVALATGSERWRAEAGDACTPYLVDAGSGSTVVTVSACGEERPALLRTYAADSGRSGLRVELPSRGVPEQLAVLSADPLTVWIREGEVRGTRAVLSYDQTGVLRTTVPLGAEDYELRATPSAGSAYRPVFAARPARTAIVARGVLIVSAVRPGDRHVNDHGSKGTTVHYDGRLAAYSLTSGRRLWTTKTRTWVQALTADGEQVWVLSGHQLARIDPSTGHLVRDIHLSWGFAPKTSADLWITERGRTYVLVNEDGTARHPPVSAAR
ncbi:PQQ-binding-like beta-propeller repeat protein [Streptomyces viridosporus]|uniref:outer membrane protein assembly factor BamB family protein n=1 Tax=Streptomyces viridosporus TaxID=67581 RepID=UPI00331DB217